MGEQADFIIDRMINYNPRSFKKPRKRTYQSNSGNYYWRTKNGVVSMYRMSKGHLLNAINICRQTNNTGKEEQLRRVLKIKYDV